MANRSYLYSTNLIPDPGADRTGRRIVSVAEYRYDIPYAYKLLLAGDPRTCRSSIFDSAGDLALLGDYEQGLSYLRAFVERLTAPVAANIVSETLEFLSKPERRQPYFLLECGEIFALNEKQDVVAQNAALLEEVRRAPESLAATADEINAMLSGPLPRPSLLARILGKVPTDTELLQRHLAPLYEVGLGSWADILYFDFGQDA